MVRRGGVPRLGETRALDLLGLALSLMIPSLSTVLRYGGVPGLLAYVLLLPLVLWLIHRFVWPWWLSSISPRRAITLGLISFAVLVVLFAVLYPIANSGVMGRGSDRDEALNLAVEELLAGRYPYYPETYLNNPITPMPGAVLLAVPWVAAGNSALQNLFWLPMLVLVLWRWLGDVRSALLLCWVIYGLSPALLLEWAVGGDFMSNSIYVLIFIGLLVHVVPDARRGYGAKLGAAALLGVGLSSRANFLLLLPTLWSALRQRAGRWSAAVYMLVTLTVWTAVTLPFYLYDPARFSPLHTSHKLTHLVRWLPELGLMLAAAALVLALVLALRRLDDDRALFGQCALIQALPVVGALVIDAAAAGRLELRYSGFGTAFVFFGALACWMGLRRGVTPDATQGREIPETG